MDKTQLPSLTTNRGEEPNPKVLEQHVTKVMIQEIPTRRYLRNGGFWTPDIEKATAFDTKSAAIEAANEQEFKNVQLLVSCESKDWEVQPIKAPTTL